MGCQEAPGVDNPPANEGGGRDESSIPGVGKILRRNWESTQAFLPGEFLWQQSSLCGLQSMGHRNSQA